MSIVKNESILKEETTDLVNEIEQNNEKESFDKTKALELLKDSVFHLNEDELEELHDHIELFMDKENLGDNGSEKLGLAEQTLACFIMATFVVGFVTIVRFVWNLLF